MRSGRTRRPRIWPAELPVDPLSAVHGRFLVPVDDQLVLAGISIPALFVHGGPRWPVDGGAGRGNLLGDAWVWTAPTG